MVQARYGPYMGAASSIAVAVPIPFLYESTRSGFAILLTRGTVLGQRNSSNVVCVDCGRLLFAAQLLAACGPILAANSPTNTMPLTKNLRRGDSLGSSFSTCHYAQ